MTQPEAEMSVETGSSLGEDVAYEPNWYRVLRALALGQDIQTAGSAVAVLAPPVSLDASVVHLSD